jgi:hypothetical protein
MGRNKENHYDFKTNTSTPNCCYRSSVFKGVVMAENKDTKYIPKCRIVPGTQEEATALNNGGARQIVLNRRTRKSDRINPIDYSDVTTNNPKEDE